MNKTIVTLRLPPTIKKAVEAAAAKSHRSLNGEIVYQLEAIYAAQAPAGERAA